jgi:hypothetical protein
MTDELVHPSRQAHMPHPTKRLRVQEPKLPAYRKQAHTSSVNTVKKKIRDVTRRLGHSDSQTATGRAEDERALAAYQQELEAAEHEKLRQKMIKKYHMVRFFGKFWSEYSYPAFFTVLSRCIESLAHDWKPSESPNHYCMPREC